MNHNVFLENSRELSLQDYMKYNKNSREHLGDTVPVIVYRLLEFSLREQLIKDFGEEEQIRIFRQAGYRTGCYFAEHLLDLSLPAEQFVAQLQQKTEELGIGVLRIEKLDLETGRITLTVSEDADCSGLPVLGKTVCNYDEGFLSGILSSYTGKPYSAVEIDCWATGDRVCRFAAEVKE